MHLALDAHDLGEPDVVDLLGGHVEGSEVADPRGVVGLAVGQIGSAESLARIGPVLVNEESVQGLVGRDDRFENCRRAVGA